MKNSILVIAIALFFIAAVGTAYGCGGWVDDGTVVRLNTSTDNVGIGIMNPQSKLEVYSDQSSSSGYNFGILAIPIQSAATSGLLTGIRGYTKSTAMTGTVSELRGIEGIAINGGNGTVTNAYGFYGQVQTASDITGTITNAYGLMIDNPYKPAGTITNNYGIYIVGQTSGTSNFALYSAGGVNYFADKVGIGTANPRSLLHINGIGNSYIQLDVNETPLASTDCDSESEKGRMIIDNTATANRMFVCFGPNGWKSITFS